MKSPKLALAVLAVRCLFRLLSATWRLDCSRAKEQLKRIIDEAEPVIFAFWHDQLPAGTFFLRRHGVDRGAAITVLVSQSRDGELGVRVVEKWGVELVRGSATRGGSTALRALIRAVTKKRRSVLTVPDGPTGPRHVVKVGSVALAQLSGAPILPLACAADRSWRLRSWDRLGIPRPFARVVVLAGSLEAVPRELDEEALEAARRHLEKRLETLTQEAEAAARRGPDSGSLRAS